MKYAVTLMTALLPTIGHENLIAFMADFVGDTGGVDVIVCGRTCEPIDLYTRVAALQQACDRIRPGQIINVICWFDDDAPQNPSTDEEWGYWRNVIMEDAFQQYDYFVSSEPYGKKMADLIGAQFIPFDLDRSIMPVKGTEVRQHIDYYFECVLPEMQTVLQKHVTIFGQESTGKTTLAAMLGEDYGSWTPEFARPYLEMMDDPTVTDEKMAVIVRGQSAIFKSSLTCGLPIVIHDTDLLSTIGYYRIYGGKADWADIEDRFIETKSDLYIVTPDNIPFVPDPLRYGGDVRESSLQFWIDLLDEFGCNYYVVRGVTETERYLDAISIIEAYDRQWFDPIRHFVRD